MVQSESAMDLGFSEGSKTENCPYGFGLNLGIVSNPSFHKLRCRIELTTFSKKSKLIDVTVLCDQRPRVTFVTEIPKKTAFAKILRHIFFASRRS